MSKPLIIQYVGLLHKYEDPDAPEVKSFLEKHLDDERFIQRAKVLANILKVSLNNENDKSLPVLKCCGFNETLSTCDIAGRLCSGEPSMSCYYRSLERLEELREKGIIP